MPTVRSTQLRSGREHQRPRPGGAARREDSGRRRLHDAGRRRDGHDAAQLHRAAQPRRLARRDASIRARTLASSRWRCNPTGRFWSAAASRHWAAAGPARRRATASGGSTPTARSTRPSIRARTTPSGPWRCNPTGRSWSAVIFTTLGGGGTGTTPRNRIGRLHADGSLDTTLQSGRERRRLRLALAARREDPGRRRLHDAGRRRDRHDAAQPHRPAQRRRLARRRFQSRRETTSSMRWRVQPDGKILVGGDFTTLGGGDRHDAAQSYRPAQPRRLARHELQSGREHVGHGPGGAAGREDPGRRAASRRWAAAGRRHDGCATGIVGGSTQTARSTRTFNPGTERPHRRPGGAAGWEDPGRR